MRGGYAVQNSASDRQSGWKEVSLMTAIQAVCMCCRCAPGIMAAATTTGGGATVTRPGQPDAPTTMPPVPTPTTTPPPVVTDPATDVARPGQPGTQLATTTPPPAPVTTPDTATVPAAPPLPVTEPRSWFDTWYTPATIGNVVGAPPTNDLMGGRLDMTNLIDLSDIFG